MKKSYLYIFLVLILMSSCVPTRDLIYLQNKGNTTNNAITPIVSKPFRLQVNDVLSISIKAIDQKLVAIFNPVADGSGGGGQS